MASTLPVSAVSASAAATPSAAAKAGSNDNQNSFAAQYQKGVQQQASSSQSGQNQASGNQNAQSGNNATAANQNDDKDSASSVGQDGQGVQQAAAAWLALLQQAQPQSAASAAQLVANANQSAATDATPLSQALLALAGQNVGKAASATTTLQASVHADGKDGKTLPGLAADGKLATTPLVATDLTSETAKLAALPANNLPQEAVSDKAGTTSFAQQLAANLATAEQLNGAGSQNSALGTNSSAAAQANQIPVPVTHSAWGDALAQRVSMMIGQQQQEISMQLNPPHMGPLEVKLNLGQDQASVVFSSQNAAVREALAAATPKLTALMADQGITLTNVQVASDSLQQQQQQAANQQAFSQQQSGRRDVSLAQWGSLGSALAGDSAMAGVVGNAAAAHSVSGVSLFV